MKQLDLTHPDVVSATDHLRAADDAADVEDARVKLAWLIHHHNPGASRPDVMHHVLGVETSA